mmetsp:Transcript_23759/g.36125  ORF Transcript_23759/g.36125 Transcript_23759/m.36125 type:complete len:83 (+) Transcript_23759:232-480(+)
MEMELDHRALILICCMLVKILSAPEGHTRALDGHHCLRTKGRKAFNAYHATMIKPRYTWVVMIALTYPLPGYTYEQQMYVGE